MPSFTNIAECDASLNALLCKYRGVGWIRRPFRGIFAEFLSMKCCYQLRGTKKHVHSKERGQPRILIGRIRLAYHSRLAYSRLALPA